MKNSSLLIILVHALLSAPSCTQPREEKVDTTKYYLIRHAEKAVDGTDDPDLSEEGHARAQKLVSILKEKNVERLYSTAYKRTQQTLQPLADTLQLDINTYDPRDDSDIARMIAECKEKTVVIVGHSNTIPGLANKLIGEDKYQELDESDYSKMWEIELDGDKVIGEKVTTY